jgi:hypothetical protein
MLRCVHITFIALQPARNVLYNCISNTIFDTHLVLKTVHTTWRIQKGFRCTKSIRVVQLLQPNPLFNPSCFFYSAQRYSSSPMERLIVSSRIQKKVYEYHTHSRKVINNKNICVKILCFYCNVEKPA